MAARVQANPVRTAARVQAAQQRLPVVRARCLVLPVT
jgi:hypothetical protein